MSLLSSRSGGADSVLRERVAVPPLFAGPVRDDLAVRIDSALSAGDHEKAAVLLHEADGAYPDDPAFEPLRLRSARLARRKAQVEAALHDALDDMSEDRLASAVSKFRQALSLSQGHELFVKRVCDAAMAAAEQHVPQHWRFAESLLDEMSAAAGRAVGSGPLWTAIERLKREETVRLALEESGRAEHTAYLPHLRDRLADLARTYPDVETLDARLRVLDGLVTRSVAEEREKNLRRLALFRDRLDLTANPETLRHFADLTAPFVDPYHDDPAFVEILGEIRDLRSKYDSALLLLQENRLQDTVLICDQILNKRPANVLFTALEEKAKSQEWVVRRIGSIMQRARAFEEKAQYSEALAEWESLKEVDPRHPGLISEMLHCAALKQQAEAVRPFVPAPADETALTPEVIDIEPESVALVLAEPTPTPLQEQPTWQPLPPRREEEPRGMKIAITPEAWNHLKTGMAAAFALLLVILVLASTLLH